MTAADLVDNGEPKSQRNTHRLNPDHKPLWVHSLRTGEVLNKMASDFDLKKDSKGEWYWILNAANGIDNARTEVYPALVLGFGHVPSLFISLWKTNPIAFAGEDCDELDLDKSIVNCNLTPEKQQAYLWLIEGCDPWD